MNCFTTIENKIGGQEAAAHEILMFAWCRGAAPRPQPELWVHRAGGCKGTAVPPGAPQAGCPVRRRECVFVWRHEGFGDLHQCQGWAGQNLGA